MRDMYREVRKSDLVWEVDRDGWKVTAPWPPEAAWVQRTPPEAREAARRLRDYNRQARGRGRKGREARRRAIQARRRWDAQKHDLTFTAELESP